MPNFQYKAILEDGSTIEQILQAKTKAEAAQILQNKGWQILVLKPAKKELTIFESKIKAVQKANFCRYLSVMMRSGLSVAESVNILYKEEENSKFKQILGDLLFSLQEGGEFSHVLSRYPEVFDEIFLSLVKSGEQSGSLEKTFAYLADQLYSTYRLNKKIQGAMMYPMVIFSAMFGIGVLMMTFVLPRLGSVFLKMKIEMPLPTMLLLKFGKFMGDHTVGVFVGIGLFLLITTLLLKNYKIKRKIMSGMANMPVIKNIFIKIDLARFSRSLATLMQSGVPVQQALQISAKMFTQNKMRKLADTLDKGIAEGKTIAQLLDSPEKIFPSLMVQTIRTGEKTGTLDQNLFELADFYEAELEDALRELMTVLEPLIMLVIGVAVGAMVIMIIAPIYSVLGNMQTPGGGPR